MPAKKKSSVQKATSSGSESSQPKKSSILASESSRKKALTSESESSPPNAPKPKKQKKRGRPKKQKKAPRNNKPKNPKGWKVGRKLRHVRRNPGRPTSFRAAYINRAYRMTLLGMKKKDIAEAFGVALGTMLQWEAQNEQFHEAFEKGAQVADELIAESLFDQAKGKKNRPPDFRATRFWLINRQRKNWKPENAAEEPTRGNHLAELIEVLRMAKGLATELSSTSNPSDSNESSVSSNPTTSNESTSLSEPGSEE